LDMVVLFLKDMIWIYMTIIKNFQMILNSTDESIREQLTSHFASMTKNLNIVCFDIKPRNCVINTDSVDVKLIDWDGNWCNTKLQNLDTEDVQIRVNMLSNIIMANHFFYTLDKNIFKPYLVLNRELYDANKEACKRIFNSSPI